MKSAKSYGVMDILKAAFLAVFALPFIGGYFMLDKEMETKVIGGILFIVGVVIWFLFGIH